jgi:hypothetical protein
MKPCTKENLVRLKEKFLFLHRAVGNSDLVNDPIIIRNSSDTNPSSVHKMRKDPSILLISSTPSFISCRFFMYIVLSNIKVYFFINCKEIFFLFNVHRTAISSGIWRVWMKDIFYRNVRTFEDSRHRQS